MGVVRVLRKLDTDLPAFRLPSTNASLFGSIGGSLFAKASETFGVEIGYRYGRIREGSFAHMNQAFVALAVEVR